MTFRYAQLLFGLLLLTAAGCSSQIPYGQSSIQAADMPAPGYMPIANRLFSQVATAATKTDKDRAAIVAMQGEFKVTFDFNETVVLAEGYKRFPPKKAGAFETVLVVENTPDSVVLQHILVVGDGHIVKHWRQDWFYEADERFEFNSEQNWKITEIDSAKRKGRWTQCVYEVSDAPRYCGTGIWNHRYGVSTWTSDRSWRPLPRREYTVRNDYNALNVENRHTVTPLGWTHEQDNTKVRREGETTDQTFVREFGFNDYRNITGYDFSPAHQYWEKTHAYWSLVRDVWGTWLKQDGYIALGTAVDGMPIIEATFKLAESVNSGETIPEKSAVQALLKQWVNTQKTDNTTLAKQNTLSATVENLCISSC